MADLIDRDALIETFEHIVEKSFLDDTKLHYMLTLEIVKAQPTIEAESVKPVLSGDERKASEAWCENCDHIEMCKWYPAGGCEFRQIGGKPAGRAEPPEEE